MIDLLTEIAALQRLEVLAHEAAVQAPALGELWRERGRLLDRLDKTRTALIVLRQQRADSPSGLSRDDRIARLIADQLHLREEELVDLEAQLQRLDLQVVDAEDALATIRKLIARTLED